MSPPGNVSTLHVCGLNVSEPVGVPLAGAGTRVRGRGGVLLTDPVRLIFRVLLKVTCVQLKVTLEGVILGRLWSHRGQVDPSSFIDVLDNSNSTILNRKQCTSILEEH